MCQLSPVLGHVLLVVHDPDVAVDLAFPVDPVLGAFDHGAPLKTKLTYTLVLNHDLNLGKNHPNHFSCLKFWLKCVFSAALIVSQISRVSCGRLPQHLIWLSALGLGASLTLPRFPKFSVLLVLLGDNDDEVTHVPVHLASHSVRPVVFGSILE